MGFPRSRLDKPLTLREHLRIGDAPPHGRIDVPLGASTFVVASDAHSDTLTTARRMRHAGYNVFICDGVDDDQTIGDAVQSLISGMGGIVKLSEGNFYFSAPVNYNSLLSAWTGVVLGKLTIEGEGPESTIIRPSGAVASLFHLEQLTKTLRHIQHRNFGMVDTSNVVTTAGIFLDNADITGLSQFNWIENVYASGFGAGDAISIHGAIVNRIKNVVAVVTGNAGIEIYAGGNTTWTIENCYVGQDGGGFGILIAGYGGRVLNCTVESANVGIELTSRFGGSSHSNKVSGCYMEGCTTDLSLRGLAGEKCRGILVDGCHFFDAAAIYLDHAEDITIIGNSFRSASATSINATSTCKDIWVGPNYHAALGTSYVSDASSRLLTIATGAIAALPHGVGLMTYYDVDTQGAAATDDLDSISGGFRGALVTIRPTNDTHTVVVKHSTGLKLSSGVDFSMANIDDFLTLLHDGTSWQEVGRSSNHV